MKIEEIISQKQISQQEAFFILQEYLKDVNKEHIEIIQFLTHPQANQIFEYRKMNSIQGFMSNPQLMFSTLNDFFNYSIQLCIDHFKDKFKESIPQKDTFRVFDKNGNFIFQY